MKTGNTREPSPCVIKEGDLTPCANLSYVYSERNRKHYNLKDCEPPKGNYIRGNENIDEWRRWE